MKKLLIETTSKGSLGYIAESPDAPRPGFLGKLKGPAADYNSPTRNDNFYSRELWEHVVASDDFIELYEAKCLFGEVDHPEDRLETLVKNAAISLVGYEFNDDNGTLDCEFDILDTPMGKIVKSLAEYGSKLGVSSRGAGDVVTRDGVDYIDPESYEFEAFDIVLQPAVKQARPTVVESLNKDKSKKLIESLQSEIDKTESESALNLIKSIVQSTNLPDSESLIDSINNKIAGIPERDTISSGLLADLEAATDKISELTDQINTLNTEVDKLKEESSTTGSKISELSSALSESRKNGKYLSSRIVKYKRSNRELSASLSESNSKLSSSKSLVAEYENRLVSSSKKIITLERLNKKITSELNTYKEKVEELESISKSNDKLIKESKKLSNKTSLELSESIKREIDSLTKYADIKTMLSGVDFNMVKPYIKEGVTVEDIDSLIESISNKRDRLKKVPIDFSGKSFKLESKSTTISDEDAQALSIMRLTKNKL